VGPENRQGRKLAFLLGGSVAFGTSSHDTTTITGYLNRKQEEYLFVNAGVPWWNSTQELFRLSYQLSEYQPDLVIAFDGFNDGIIYSRYKRRGDGRYYPPGTPKSFGKLHDFVDDIRSGNLKQKPKQDVVKRPFYKAIPNRLVPRTYHALWRWKERWSGEQAKPAWLEMAAIWTDEDDHELTLWASKYVTNLTLMKAVTESWGGRFVGIFQPVKSLHSVPIDLGRPLKRWERDGAFVMPAFYKNVVASMMEEIEYYDFSSLFDGSYWAHQETNGPLPFYDSCHFNDKGNEIVADSIIQVLGLNTGS